MTLQGAADDRGIARPAWRLVDFIRLQGGGERQPGERRVR
jgi:hypothetical protein